MPNSIPPPTPEDISVFIENDRVVFRADTHSLYTFDKDPSGQSSCTGTCEQLWPPVAARSSAKAVGDWSPITRPDASKQWAYKGRPVYTYSRDEAGQTSGDGIDGLWHVVKP